MMKYIIFPAYEKEVPVLFPTILDHARVAKSLSGLFVEPVSAGYVAINFDNEVKVGGDSMTLRLKTRDVDAQIISNWLRKTEV